MNGKRTCHADSKHKETEMVQLISSEIDFKETIIRDKRQVSQQ